MEAYSDAFNESMRVCACIASIAVLSAFATAGRKQPNVVEYREQQQEEEENENKLAPLPQAVAA